MMLHILYQEYLISELLGIMIYLSLCFQINTNGIISVNQSFLHYQPQLFPNGSRYLVAPFWADVDIRGEVGNISYQVSTGSPALDTVNTIISDEESITFTGHWMIVAEWDEVPAYPYLKSLVSFMNNKCD